MWWVCLEPAGLRAGARKDLRARWCVATRTDFARTWCALLDVGGRGGVIATGLKCWHEDAECDPCNAICLQVLARRNHALGDWAERVLRAGSAEPRPRAAVRFWSTHDQLHAHVRDIVAGGARPCGV